MNLNNRVIALVLRASIVIAGLLGIVLHMTAVKSVRVLGYFSIVTTAAGVGFTLYLFLKTLAELKFSGSKGTTMLDIPFRGMVLGGILSSVVLNLALWGKGVSYSIMLGQNGNAPRLVGALLVNVIFPLLVFADWLFCSKKFRFTGRDAFLWLSYPMCFFLAHLVRGAILSRKTFFYFFLDYPAMGMEGVILNVAVLAALMLTANLFFVLLDTLLGEPMVLFSWKKGSPAKRR